MLNKAEIEQIKIKRERFLQFLQHDSTNIKLRENVIELHYQLGECPEAQKQIEYIQKLEPNNISVKLYQGLIALSTAQFSEAEEHFKALLETDPENPALLYNLTYCLMLQQRYQEAEPIAKKAAEQADSFAQATQLYIDALHFNGKVEEAIAFAEQSLNSDPQYHNQLHGPLSSLYLDQENWQQAKEHAKQILIQNPNDTDGLTTIGTLLLAQRDAEQAEKHFDKAIKSYPTNGRAWAGKAMSTMLKGDLAQSEDLLKETLKYMPNHIGTWQVLAWCQILQQHLNEAKETLSHLMQMNTKSAETHGTLAVVQVMRKELESAKESVRVSLKLDPKCFSGLFARNLLLQTEGKPEKAQMLLDSLLNTSVLPDGTTIAQAAVKMMGKMK